MGDAVVRCRDLCELVWWAFIGLLKMGQLTRRAVHFHGRSSPLRSGQPEAVDVAVQVGVADPEAAGRTEGVGSEAAMSAAKDPVTTFRARYRPSRAIASAMISSLLLFMLRVHSLHGRPQMLDASLERHIIRL